jgi:hypothetical protein
MLNPIWLTEPVKCNECAADIIHLSYVLDMIFDLQKSRQLILQL